MNVPTLTPSVYVPIGAVVAACIAAAISFLTLVISKEQKISEFRQAWIDGLRGELAEFAANARRIAAQPTFVNWKSLTAVSAIEQLHAANEDATRVDPVAENRLRLAQSFYAVRLRLNLEEEDHKALIGSLKNVLDLLNGSSASLSSVSDELESMSPIAQGILKREWNRVKEGESAFTKAVAGAKWLAGGFLVLLLAAVGYAIWSQRNAT